MITPRYTQKFIDIFSPAVTFLLKWINILFSPAFILIPNSNSITLGELGKVIGVFVIGLLLSTVLTTYLIRGFQSIKRRIFQSHDRPTENHVESHGPESKEASVIDLADVDSLDDPTLNEKNSVSPGNESFSSKGNRSFDGQIELSEIPAKTSKLMRCLETYSNTIIYLVLFVPSFIAYLVTGQTLPVQLTLNVLSFYAALAVPFKIRRFLHPIITCSALMILFIYLLALMKGQGLHQGLAAFSTGTRYLVLFDPSRTGSVPQLGAGDVLYSLLDGSIVSLSFNMFKYRKELRDHAFEMIPTIVILSVSSLFLYPLVAGAIHITPPRALSFAGRAVTTPLAINIETVLGGDVGMTVVFVILTGIIGAVCGPWFLRCLGVDSKDYVAVGVSMGCNAHAISTAALLEVDLKAAAISSLSFVLFGTVIVILVAIPTITNVIQGFVL
ncbi:hypothetical protein K7432_008728 [Basidiobolus ranarum]|uniref:Uncharacterized protein n=1 Tax=Basidiobolus ranarum TaxID=34480 RepID=A0ABR2VY44_9FUNG